MWAKALDYGPWTVNHGHSEVLDMILLRYRDAFSIVPCQQQIVASFLLARNIIGDQ